MHRCLLGFSSRTLVGFSTALAFGSFTSSFGQDPLQGIVLESAPNMMASGVVALGIAVVRGDETHLATFGRLKPDEATEPATNTFFSIGSVSKGFTGLLLADMVKRGEVRLDQPVSELLPEGWTMPEHKAGPVTLAHLASHTSGLPRLPANFWPATRPGNPYADYKLGRMKVGVEKIKYATAPGERYAYSNFAVALLGVVLARKAGFDSYEAVLRERILEPVGMHRTWVSPVGEAKQQLAPGYDARRAAQPMWDMPLFGPAGGIRSDLTDMEAFLHVALDPPENLVPAFDLAMKPVKKIRSGHICLGWHRARDGSTYWHNGQTGGYHAYCAFNRKHDVAVMVMATGNPKLVDAFGEHLVRRLAGVADKPFKAR